MAHNFPVGTPTPPAHTVPSRSSRSLKIHCPASCEYCVSLPPLQLTSPLSAPIQRVPSRVTSRLLIAPEGKCWSPGGCQGTALIPSKRSKPYAVPSHK